MLILVLDNYFVEVSRLKGQIKINLGISLKKLPQILHRENYGWAEEDGDKILLQISNENCATIISALASKKPFAELSEYAQFFKKKEI